MTDVALTQLREHPANVRESLGDLTEMTASIRAHGILQPIIVQPHPTEKDAYLILGGHRRAAAARLAGLTRVPVTVRAAAGSKAVEIMLIENCQRSDLGPVEKAEAMGKLRRRGMTAADISRSIGLSQATVSYFLSLLDLDAASRERVREGRVAVGDAVKAVRSTRRQQRGGTTGRRKATVEAEHFSHRHPLADNARLRCQLAGHEAVRYGRDRAEHGKVACGECWEYVIRADERGEQLPADAPSPTLRKERMQVVASLPMLSSATPDGEHITTRQAAERLGVTPRSIERYKAEIGRAS